MPLRGALSPGTRANANRSMDSGFRRNDVRFAKVLLTGEGVLERLVPDGLGLSAGMTWVLRCSRSRMALRFFGEVSGAGAEDD